MSISGDKYCLVDTDKRNDGRLENPMIKLLSSVSAEKHFGTVINRNRNRNVYDASRTTNIKYTLIQVKQLTTGVGPTP